MHWIDLLCHLWQHHHHLHHHHHLRIPTWPIRFPPDNGPCTPGGVCPD
jgi:hypothetical protein